jgi:hypothetical protein
MTGQYSVAGAAHHVVEVLTTNGFLWACVHDAVCYGIASHPLEAGPWSDLGRANGLSLSCTARAHEVGWSKVHALLGCLIQLQTWAQSLAFHLHTHCVVPCGGFSEDGSRWISFEPHDLPADELSDRFRMLLCEAIRTAAGAGKFERLPKNISVDQILLAVMGHEWKVYAEPPFGGPEQLLAYLARYTSRVAITNDRIVSYENRQVTFRGRDWGDDQVQLYKFEGEEFVRRFVEHVPPKGFVRIRSYGFMANRNRKQNLERARQLIGQTNQTQCTQRLPPAPFQPFRALRLCPACTERRRQERMGHVAPQPHVVSQPDVASQVALSLRPPPIHPVAA